MVTNGPDPSGMTSESRHQAKNQGELSFLLGAKGIWDRWWNKAVTNSEYDHVTRYREEAVIVMSISSLFCFECVCVYETSLFSSLSYPLTQHKMY